MPITCPNYGFIYMTLAVKTAPHFKKALRSCILIPLTPFLQHIKNAEYKARKTNGPS